MNSFFLNSFFKLSLELSFLNPFFKLFFCRGLIFLFANPHCFRFLIFEFYFFGGFDAKSFLAFLVSEKLDAKLSDNLLKSAFFIGVSGAKREREWFQSTSYPFKKIK